MTRYDDEEFELMDHTDFYNDRKYCTECRAYVPYLQSLEHSYCANCGRSVRLFSEKDWQAFHESLKDKKPKGGRPRKGHNKESA
jgi:hypothetical protein